MKNVNANEAVKTARVILFENGNPDKAVEVESSGLAGEFVQGVTDVVLGGGVAGDFLAGLFFTLNKNGDGHVDIGGAAVSEGKAYMAQLLAVVIADHAIKHAEDPKRYCGYISDMALAHVRSRLMEARKSPGGVILPESGIIKG